MTAHAIFLGKTYISTEPSNSTNNECFISFCTFHGAQWLMLLKTLFNGKQFTSTNYNPCF